MRNVVTPAASLQIIGSDESVSAEALRARLQRLRVAACATAIALSHAVGRARPKFERRHGRRTFCTLRMANAILFR